MNNELYVHGYSEKESIRLYDQAVCLEQLLHHDTVFPPGSRVLEAGCGVGAQTKIIAKKNPDSFFVSMDISAVSLEQAGKLIREMNITNVEFQQGDIFNLNFKEDTFDHILVCFVLEHLSEPVRALQSLQRVLKRNGSIVVIEGDHGSAFFYPDSPQAAAAIQSQVHLQSLAGGNALIGRKLYPLLTGSGFGKCTVSPRMVYADPGRPELVEGFTKNTFTAMIKGVEKEVLQKKLIKKEVYDKGIQDLYCTAGEKGVFCYTFFKGTGYKL